MTSAGATKAVEDSMDVVEVLPDKSANTDVVRDGLITTIIVLRKALTKSVDCALTLEAGKASPKHGLHGHDELWCMWTQCEKGGNTELLKEHITL
jgi:hypothetical protein